MKVMSKRRSERGAYAVMFAILALFLMAIAGLAVDLGNAYARKSDVQGQADFAALAAGAELDSVSGTVPPAVVAAARDFLNNNKPFGDDSVCPGGSRCVTSVQLIDGNLGNGEVRFANGGLQVHTPLEFVDYGLAGVMGFDGDNVQGDATVGLFSPGPMVPFFLPHDCAAGTVILKASSYNPGAPTFDPPSANGNTIATLNSLNTTTVPGAVASTLTIFGEKFTSPLLVDFTKEEGSVDDRVPDMPAPGITADSVTLYASQDDEATVTLPPAVFNKPGEWYLRVNNGNGWSRDVQTFIVGNPTPPPAGCGQRSTGDFGVVDSPRTVGPVPSNNLAEATALNMALGLDHNPSLWSQSTTAPLPPRDQDACSKPAPGPAPGAVLDVAPSKDGVNCVEVKTGMNTDTVTEGMVAGVNTSPITRGRLDTGSSTCDRTGGTTPRTVLAKSINDDVLSCFLPAGVTVGQVSGETLPTAFEGVLDEAIFDSPRFMVVPVIDFPINPQNGFYPIVTMKPVFITDETYASQKGTSYATVDNGVLVQGTKVVQLTVVAIHEKALPEITDHSGAVVPYYGSGPKILRLID